MRDHTRRAGPSSGTALARLLLVFVLGAIGAAACGPAPPPEPYQHLLPTREAVAEAVVTALETRDPDRLKDLAVSELEYRKNLWPHLPASRPEVGMPFEYVWTDTSTKSLAYLGQTLARQGGRHLTVRAVTFGGPPTDYGSFRIHPEATVTVADREGTTESLRLFGSMLETPEGWKVFSYIVD